MQARHIIIVLLCLVSSFLVLAEINVDVFRMIQYDKVVGGSVKTLGCRKTGISATATTFTTLNGNSNNNASETSSVFASLGARQVVVLKLRELFQESTASAALDRFKSLATNNNIVGIIILIPKNLDLKGEAKGEWSKFEKLIFTEMIDTPVYFLPESDELKAAYAALQNEESTSSQLFPESFSLLIGEKEASLLGSTPIFNFQGMLKGYTAFEGAQLPTIAVVAHYDTLSVVPELSRGMGTSGASTIALLELARLYNMLYASVQTRGAVNLLFLLTGGGSVGFDGSKQWVKKMDNNLYENLDFVLALDAMAGEKLYLHISEKTKNDHIIRLYKDFQSTATQLNIPFEIVYSNLDMTAKELAWEHEVYAQKKISAATLSSGIKPFPALSGIFAEAFDSKLLERNIRFVAESLSKHIYNVTKNVDIFQGSVSVSSSFVETWRQTLNTYSRTSAFLTKDAPIIDALKHTMSQLTNEATTQELEYKGNFKFYNNPKTSLTIYKVKPFSFEFLLLVPVACYLMGIYIYLVGWSSFLTSCMAVIKPAAATKRAKK